MPTWPATSHRLPLSFAPRRSAFFHAQVSSAKVIRLRSNVTIRNLLQCPVAIIFEAAAGFERMHAQEAASDYHRLLRPDGTYSVPLHLVSCTRLTVRPLTPAQAASVSTIGSNAARLASKADDGFDSQRGESFEGGR